MEGFDPRRVANLLLDLADERDIEVCHVKLQKLLYFADDAYGMRTGKQLIAGDFEAWQHGPVNPTIYRVFKKSGSQPISFRAEEVDLLTGEVSALPKIHQVDVLDELILLLRSRGRASAWQLVEISHAQSGPWFKVREAMAAGINSSAIVPRRFANSASVFPVRRLQYDDGSRSPLKEKTLQQEKDSYGKGSWPS